MRALRPTSHPPLTVAIVALGVTQIIGWGTTFYLPAILAQSVAAELDVSRTQYLLAFSWSLLLAGLSSRRLGRLIDQIGAAPVLAASSLITAGALVFQSTATDAWMIWASWTLVGVTLRAVLYDGAFAALTALSSHQARRSISLITLAGGLASTVFWPIGGWLTEWTDWRTTLLVYAALNALICGPLHWWCAGQVRAEAKSSDVDIPPSAGGSIVTKNNDSPPASDPIFRERAIRLFAAALALHALISYALSTHLPDLLEGLGLSGPAALLAASLMGPAQVIARIVELRLQRSIPALSLTVPVFLIMPIAFIGFVLLPQIPASQAGVIGALVVMLWGSANGLMTIIRGTLPVQLFGATNYGETLGRLAAPALYLGAIAPVWFGITIDLLTPAGASAILCALSALATVLAWRLVQLARRQASSSIQAC